MSCPSHPCAAARLVIRSVDRPDVWGQLQVLECRECGFRWSA